MNNSWAFEQRTCEIHGDFYISPNQDEYSKCHYCSYINLSSMDILNSMDFSKRNVELLLIHKLTEIHFVNFIGMSSKELIPYVKKYLKEFHIYLIDTYINEDSYRFYNKKLAKFGGVSGFSFKGELYHWEHIWGAKTKAISTLRDSFMELNPRCPICNNIIKQPVLDHMHTKKVKGTGFIRNVCCSQCNTFIARSENNAGRHGISNEELPDVLRRMANHLENQTRIIHSTELPKKKKLGTRDWNKIIKFYFKIYPGRKKLPKRPRFISESVLELCREVNKYITDNNKKDKLINLEELC